jgi:putative aldouronate transport system substrate-binding protein
MAKREHKLMDDILKVSFPLPTVGLVSQTDLTKGAALKKVLGQSETDIILGRKPLSSWDSAVKTWLAGGGTQIGHEYEDAYAKSGRG